LCLDQLPEAEKDYDRDAAIQTMKGIVAMRYTLAPPQPDQERSM
jgi:hypothetical protein